MKKGKTTKINGFRSSKVLYGTVDSKEFKSLYLNLQTWVEPKDDYENWSRIVLNMNRSIKHSIFDNLDKTLFDDKYIVDYISTKGDVLCLPRCYIQYETGKISNTKIYNKALSAAEVSQNFNALRGRYGI